MRLCEHELRTAETLTWNSPSLGFSLPPASSSKENEKKGMTTVSEDFSAALSDELFAVHQSRDPSLTIINPGHLIYAQMALTRSPLFFLPLRCFISGVHDYFQAALKPSSIRKHESTLGALYRAQLSHS